MIYLFTVKFYHECKTNDNKVYDIYPTLENFRLQHYIV